MPKAKALTVGIVLYDRFDSLDVLGPFQTFTFAGMTRFLVAETLAPVISFEGVSIKPHATFDTCPKLDILMVPGGATPVDVLLKGHPGSNPVLDFLIARAPDAHLVCSVCTGALLLAGAGLLNGYDATTHWAYKDVLRLFPVKVVNDYRRYIKSDNRITSAGISAGLDVSMYIVSLVLGLDVARQCQLAMQYNPQPPFHCGDPDDSEIRDNPGMVEERKKAWDVADATKQVAEWICQG